MDLWGHLVLQLGAGEKDLFLNFQCSANIDEPNIEGKPTPESFFAFSTAHAVVNYLL